MSIFIAAFLEEHVYAVLLGVSVSAVQGVFVLTVFLVSVSAGILEVSWLAVILGVYVFLEQSVSAAFLGVFVLAVFLEVSVSCVFVRV